MKQLFFLAIIPPSPLFGSIEELKKTVARDYGTEHVLTAPAHLTLVPPFPFEEDLFSLLQKEITAVTQDFRPFSVILDGFQFFEPKVLFLHVLQNRSLRVLEKQLRERLFSSFPSVEWKPPVRFHPHISLATKIPNDGTFFQIQKEYSTKKFHADFPVSTIALLEWKNHDHWEVRKSWKLQGSS